MVSEMLLEKWSSVRSGLIETLSRFEADELTFRPFAGAYSVADLALHVAHEERIEVHWGLMRSLGDLPEAYDAASLVDIASICAVLSSAHELTIGYLRGLSDEDLSSGTELAWGQIERRIDQLWHA